MEWYAIFGKIVFWSAGEKEVIHKLCNPKLTPTLKPAGVAEVVARAVYVAMCLILVETDAKVPGSNPTLIQNCSIAVWSIIQAVTGGLSNKLSIVH